MGRARVLVAIVAAALLCAGGASAVFAGTHAARATTQELTITVSDNTKLACGLVLPEGSPPSGGWPGLILFHDQGQSHFEMEDVATSAFAPAGFASLACDARGTGESGGKFGLDGPREVQDARDLFTWLAARPDVSDTKIGAYGLSLGGAEVWNAAVAGVPFKAIVPGLSWTSLARALTPNGVLKSQLLTILTQVFPLSRWDAALAQVRSDLLEKGVTEAVVDAFLARSSRDRLHSLTVPTLMIQNRRDPLFDLDQATAAYKLLRGPKRLYIGPPTRALAEVVAWFKEYLADGSKLGNGVELTHTPWDGTTTWFRNLPPTRSVSVNLPGKKAASGVLRGSVRLPGGPLETFGDGSVTVRYSGASSAWTQMVATVSLKGASGPVTQGAAPITAPAGVVKIPLLNAAVLLGRGKRLVVRLGPVGGLFYGTAPPSPAKRAITVSRVTLRLSVLKRAVSR